METEQFESALSKVFSTEKRGRDRGRDIRRYLREKTGRRGGPEG